MPLGLTWPGLKWPGLKWLGLKWLSLKWLGKPEVTPQEPYGGLLSAESLLAPKVHRKALRQSRAPFGERDRRFLMIRSYEPGCGKSVLLPSDLPPSAPLPVACTDTDEHQHKRCTPRFWDSRILPLSQHSNLIDPKFVS